MRRMLVTVAAATFGLALQPAAACERGDEALQATPFVTAALQIHPEAAEPASQLPSIASLTADSNFAVFMQPGVDSSLRTAALRKLWQLNPVFSQSDGLDSDFLDHRQ